MADSKLVIVDECLVPRRLTYLNYKGPDPMAFLKDYGTALRFIFDVSTTRVRQKKLLWDYTGDPIRFYIEHVINKEFSRFSTMIVSIRTIGHIYKTKNEGDFSTEMYGHIENTFDPSNWFTKYVWLFYNYIFYKKVREGYIQMCRNYIQAYLNWAKEKYNLKTVTTAEAEVANFEDDLAREAAPL